uniref:Uncharacterized protein n=1 Tax=Picea sitchensis TaxID=3332 RepID=A9NTW9_PICSI|nr:unknown [Picea sitchensis]
MRYLVILRKEIFMISMERMHSKKEWVAVAVMIHLIFSNRSLVEILLEVEAAGEAEGKGKVKMLFTP